MALALAVISFLILALNPTEARTTSDGSFRQPADASEALPIPSCFHMVSEEGVYELHSTGSHEVCGFYVIAKSDRVVELEFLRFDMDCEKQSLLSVVDGWEMQGQFFPAPSSQAEYRQRYRMFCGEQSPVGRKMISSQNAAMLQYRSTTPGESFRVRVRLFKNPEPCDAIAMTPLGKHTLANFGREKNCSLSVIYPLKVRVTDINVGVLSSVDSLWNQVEHSGIFTKCAKRGISDYVELLTGDGLDPRKMKTVAQVCGFDEQLKHAEAALPCGSTVIRLRSSGQYWNSVTFEYEPLEEVKPEFMKICV